MDGPWRPIIGRFDAAPQLSLCGHSCIVQHFVGFNVGLRTNREFAARSSNISCRPFISDGDTQAKDTKGSST
jgi:hypothetical protein